MADSVTTNYEWVKPEVGASPATWGGKLNSDLDGIDATVKAVSDAAERAATTTQAGQVELATSAEVATGTDATLAVTPDALADLFVGIVAHFACSTPPAGWLERDGSAVSRTGYAKLFSRIGTTWGAGDGSTTFNLPDARGEFDRGWDHGRGIDVGRAFASFQADDLKAHTHTVELGSNDVGAIVADQGSNPATTDNTGSTGGVETRPRNYAYLPCIKY